MASHNKKRSPPYHSPRNLSFEQLEERYVFDASLAIHVDLGAVDDGLVSDEFTVAGLQPEVTSAQAIGLSDSSHVFLFGEQRQNSTEIYARHTPADGQPGSGTKLLRSISNTATAPIEFDAVGTDNQQFVLTWQDVDGLHAQLFDINLDPISAVVDVAQFTSTSVDPSFEPGAFLDVFQQDNGDVIFAYSDPATGVIAVEGFSDDLTTTTDLHWTSDSNTSPTSFAFNLEISQTSDAVTQLTWMNYDSGSPQTWAIQTADFEDNDFAGLDTWTVDEFLSAPELEVQKNGNVILAGLQFQSGQVATVIETYDAAHELINTYIAEPNSIPLDVGGSLAVGTDGTYSLVLFRQEYGQPEAFVSTFNANGQLIGNSQQLNQSDLFNEPKAIIVALENGGFATYWAGTTLDETAAAVFSRTLRLEQTDLKLQIDSANEENQSLFGAYVQIDGIPTDAGLNTGQRVGENQWLIPLEDIDSVRLVTFGERQSLNLTVRLFPVGATNPLAETKAIFGSNDDDFLVPTENVNSVFGYEGLDRLVLDGEVDDYQIEQISESRWRLTSLDNAHDFVFQNLEEFQFDDQLLSLGNFLDAVNSSDSDFPTTVSDDIADQTEAPAFPSLVATTGNQNGSSGTTNSPAPNGFANSIPGRDVNNPIPGEILAATSQDREYGSDSKSVSKHHRQSQEKTAKDSLERNNDVEKRVVVEDNPTAEVNQQNSTPVENKPVPTTPTADVIAGPPAESLAPVTSDEHAQQLLRHIPGAPLIPIADRTNAIGQQTALPPTVFAKNIAPAFNDHVLFEAIDRVEQELVDDSMTSEVLVGSAVVVATGFSIAQIAWLLRSSALVTKLMTSLPIWVSFDPLPLLNRQTGLRADISSSESLLDIVNAKP